METLDFAIFTDSLTLYAKSNVFNIESVTPYIM